MKVSIAALAGVLVLAAVPAGAQPVISAKSGTIADVLGTVYLGNQLVESSLTRFPDIKENTVVRTEQGRVEVLLTPGVFLRLGENGSFRLLTNRLIDTRLELLTGSAEVEADEIARDTNVTFVLKDSTVTLSKAGLYRFDAEPARIKVFKGNAIAHVGDQNIGIGSGKMLNLGGESAAIEKFDAQDTDSLDNWNQRRSEYVSMANVSAAKYVQDNYGGLGSSAWGWNPYFGMYTFLPFSGQVFSPYGYAFWSPVTVGRVFSVPPSSIYGGNGGGYGPTRGGSGQVGGMMSAPARVSAPAASYGSMGMGASSPAASSGASGGGSGRSAAAGGAHGR